MQAPGNMAEEQPVLQTTCRDQGPLWGLFAVLLGRTGLRPEPESTNSTHRHTLHHLTLAFFF